MPTHEHFEELSALAAIGQLSPKEHSELLEHLRSCDSCRRVGDEFAAILGQLPTADPHEIEGETEQFLIESHRRKFFERAAAQGIRFTKEVTRTKHVGLLESLVAGRKWRMLAFAAMCATLVVLVAFAISARFQNMRAGVASAIAVSQKNDLQQRSAAVTPPSAKATSQPRTDSSNALLVRQLNGEKRELAEALQEKDRIQKQYESVRGELAALQSGTAAKIEMTARQEAELDKLKNDQAQMLAALISKEDKIRDLSNQLTAQNSALERERELDAAARDIRELMGARNLHMIDVYDFDTRGKRDKSFGRVYYIENKKLLFYAFDLGERGSSSKVSFQAWAQRGSEGAKPRNLGTFYIDDHDQKRWVLRVDDPKLLSSIESIFVTMEPSPGRDTPSGKKILFAYLGTEANHP